jgi:surfeit locus 1 family protein
MAKIVLGIGSSHGPQLALPPEQWHRRATADRGNSELWYRGQTYTFPELVAERGAGRFASELGDEKAARQSLLDARARETPVVLTGPFADPQPLLYRRVRASGEWIPEGQVFIDIRIGEGRAGFHVITPLRLAGTKDAVLVNRGWIARGAEYPKAPRVPVPPGAVEISGIATIPPRRVLELAAETVSGNVWQNLSIERYRERTSIPVVPILVLSEAPAAGLAPVRESPDAGEAKHREYALTWFSLAATTLALWIGLNLRRAS